jgi:AAA15 family ATPase/GTPase
MKPIDIIGLKNFRIFNDENGILEELSSINILTGANNSGKSSIIKALQMLKNSIKGDQFPFDLDLTEQGHLLGDFDNILFNKANRDILISLPFTFMGMTKIYISLLFRVPTASDTYKAKLRKIEIIDKEDDQLLFSFAYRDASEAEKEAYTEEFRVKWEEYDLKRKTREQGEPQTMFNPDYLFPPFEDPLVGYIEWSINLEKLKTYLKSLLEFYKAYLKNKRDRKFLEHADKWEGETSFIASFLIKSLKDELNPETWNDFIENGMGEETTLKGKEHVGENDLQAEDFFYAPPEIENVLYYTSLRILREKLNWKNSDKDENTYSVLEECFKSSWKQLIQRISTVHYISTIKEENSRIYLGTSNSPFTNLLKDYNSLQLDHSNFFIRKYLEAFEIGREIKVDYELKYQLIKVLITTLEGSKRELVDFGYGIKQLILILMQISVLAEKNKSPREDYDDDGQQSFSDYYYPSLLVIEEPETNLHPKWQSLLAEMFAEANALFNIQMVIETHSEYLIRKFQTLVASEKIDGKAIKIFYLRGLPKVSAGKKQVETIEIQNDGSINYKAFDDGFFDEGENLEMSLLNFQRDRFLKEFEELKITQKEDEVKITELEAKIDSYINKLDINRYQQTIEQRFDTSKLSTHTSKYLISGQFMLNTIDSSSGDFSPVILQYGRSVENELKQIFLTVNPSESWMFGNMQASMERFKNGSTTKRSCTPTEFAVLSCELTNQFYSPTSLRIDLLDTIRDTRNSAAHPGQTKTKQDALDYIQDVNDFLDKWIAEKK